MSTRVGFFVGLFMIGGCASVPPIMNTIDVSKVDFSDARDFKRGESCTTFIFGVIPFGSTRITSAVRDGRIKSLKVAEYEWRNFIVFNQFCLIAYGN